MSAPLNKYGLETFFIFGGFQSGKRSESFFFIWWSMISKSVVSEQKKIALGPCQSSFETDFALGWFLDIDGWNLVS